MLLARLTEDVVVDDRRIVTSAIAAIDNIHDEIFNLLSAGWFPAVEEFAKYQLLTNKPRTVVKASASGDVLVPAMR